MTSWTRYPPAAPTIAYAIPVLPLVLSRMMRSCVSAPLRSPSWIMRSAGRSFTDPPGFMNSALAYTAASGTSFSKSRRRSSGVLPMQSRMPRSRTSRTTCIAGDRAMGSMAPIIRAPIVLPIEPSAGAAGQRGDAEPGGASLLVLDDRDHGLRPHEQWAVLAGQLDEPGGARALRYGGLHILGAELDSHVAAVGETNNCHVVTSYLRAPPRTRLSDNRSAPCPCGRAPARRRCRARAGRLC